MAHLSVNSFISTSAIVFSDSLRNDHTFSGFKQSKCTTHQFCGRRERSAGPLCSGPPQAAPDEPVRAGGAGPSSRHTRLLLGFISLQWLNSGPRLIETVCCRVCIGAPLHMAVRAVKDSKRILSCFQPLPSKRATSLGRAHVIRSNPLRMSSPLIKSK